MGQLGREHSKRARSKNESSYKVQTYTKFQGAQQDLGKSISPELIQMVELRRRRKKKDEN